MIDSEDIINSIIEYLTQDVGGGISRINQAIIDTNTKKGDSLLPAVSNDIILCQRSKENNTFQVGHMGLDIMGEAKFQPQYDDVAKHYEVEVSYIIRDVAGSSNVFLRALRMEGVITRVMTDYFKTKMEPGMMDGVVTGSFTPERVLLGNANYKGIKSGVTYLLILR